MKKLMGFAALWLLIVLGGCQSDPTRFVLNGTLRPNDGVETVYLKYEKDGTRVCDTARVSDGCFRFEGHIDGAVAATLLDNRQRELECYLSPANMEFVGSPAEPYDFTLTNSPMNDEYTVYMKKVLPLYKRAEALQQAARQGNGGNVQGEFELLRQELGKIDREVLKRPSSRYGIILLERNLSSLSLKEIKAYFDAYSEEVHNSSAGKKVAAYLQRAASLQPGQPAPQLEGTDINGQHFRLSDLKGKYIILDFWASWCGPCRASNPHLIELWKKYHEKGLEIVCVADDDGNEKAWHAAVEQDGIGMFHHLLSGKKRNADGSYDFSADKSKIYNVHFLPTKFFIDADGKMVGKMDTGEMEAKLAEAFGK